MKLSVQDLNSHYGPAHILFDIALEVGDGDADGPLGLRPGQFGGRRVARSVLGDGGVQVGQDLHAGAAGVLLPSGEPFRPCGRIVGFGLAGGAGQVLPPLPPGPR